MVLIVLVLVFFCAPTLVIAVIISKLVIIISVTHHVTHLCATIDISITIK